MFGNLIIVALVVAIFWVLILGIYLLVSRRQADVAAQMKTLEEHLDRVEREAEQR